MIAPTVIEVVFWIAVAGVLISGVAQLGQNVVAGLLIIVLGPLVARIYAELLLVLFRINDAVQDMRNGRPNPAPLAPPIN
jgi:hypothetical protein